MKLTTEHSASSYGQPVFVDDDGRQMNYPEGIKTLLKLKKWTYQDLADATGYSKRTVEGWGQDRVPPKPALIIISYLI